ncbi:MAG: response regulator transcription factor [Spirochaetaceae bacterium]|jgi:DNA-binding response OmpR family regulator|nr:response regulator transcription factor [Spirochaetaceae bacterium]
MINRKKILIADHDALNLDFFDLMLSKLGFVVEKAQDGSEVLSKVTNGHDEGYPDLIVINTVLPKVSGWEILKAVKADPKTSVIPVLLLSEIDDVKEIVEAFEIGADDYILKPFNFSVVLARIRAALRNSVLFSQLRTREKRLTLAEKSNVTLKHAFLDLEKAIDDLMLELTQLQAKENSKAFTGQLIENAMRVQNIFSKAEKIIEHTETEWENLKEQEIGLTILEKPIRGTVNC